VATARDPTGVKDALKVRPGNRLVGVAVGVVLPAALDATPLPPSVQIGFVAPAAASWTSRVLWPAGRQTLRSALSSSSHPAPSRPTWRT
jgi:hypothetical protein